MVHSNHILRATKVKSHLGSLLLLVLLTCASSLYAASGYCDNNSREVSPPKAKVVFNGVELAVAERVEINSDLVRLSLGDESALVSKVSEGLRVAVWYLSSSVNSRELDLLQFKGLLAAGIVLRDEELLDLALARATEVGALCSDCEVAVNGTEFWRDLNESHDSDAADFLHNALVRIDSLKLPKREIADRVCQARAVVVAGLSLNRKKWDNLALQSNSYIDLCLGSLIANYLRDLFSGGSAGLSREELKRIGELVAVKHNSSQTTEFALRLSMIEDLTEALSSGDSARFASALSRVKELSKSLDLDLTEFNLRERFIERAIANRSFGDALLEFKFIDLKHRSPKTHTLLLKILKGITLNDRALLSDPEVNLLMRIYSQKDSEVRAALVSTYSRIARKFSDQGLFDSAIILAREFKGLGVDLDELTPGFGENLVVGRLAQSDRAGALALVGEFNLKLSVITRLRLFLARFGIFSLKSISLCGAALTLLLLGVIAARYFRRIDSATYASKVEPQAIPKVQKKEPIFSGDYIAALTSFSLKPGVTKEEIKNAYRAAVKRCHPDLKGVKEGVLDGAESATTNFIELKERYERLLKLHEVEAGGR